MIETYETPKSTKLYTIAVDFDGTIVEHKYPEIGEEIPGAVDHLKRLIKDGHRIILWTVRERELLDEALAWCHDRGITFYAVNKDYPEVREEDTYFSRKPKVDIFIDDRCIGGLPDWPTMYRVISEGNPHKPLHITTTVTKEQEEMMQRYQAGKRGRKGGFFKRR